CQCVHFRSHPSNTKLLRPKRHLLGLARRERSLLLPGARLEYTTLRALDILATRPLERPELCAQRLCLILEGGGARPGFVALAALSCAGELDQPVASFAWATKHQGGRDPLPSYQRLHRVRGSLDFDPSNRRPLVHRHTGGEHPDEPYRQ